MRISDLPSRTPRPEAMKIKEFVRVQTKKPERIALRLSHDDDDDRRKIGITGGEGAEGGGGMDTIS